MTAHPSHKEMLNALRAEIAVEIDTIVTDHMYTGDEVINTLRSLALLIDATPPCDTFTVAAPTPTEGP